jgi:hypothetical protein
MSDSYDGSDFLPLPLPRPRLQRMARAFNCPEIASDALGPVVTALLNSCAAGSSSQTNSERLTALQGQLDDQEQKCFFGFAPFDERT